MLAYVIFFLMAISCVVSIILGNGDALLSGAIAGAQNGVELCVGLAGTVLLWSGLFRVARKAGLLSFLSRCARPITRILFREVKDPQAMQYITTNIVANFVGIGNAATPAGLAAMSRMRSLGEKPPMAAMATFCVLNGASVQLIPTTVISLRAQAGSAVPADILVCVWVTSLVAAIVGLVLIRGFTFKR